MASKSQAHAQVQNHTSEKDSSNTTTTDTTTVPQDKPLTCLFFFFASQMHSNLQPADPDLVRRRILPDQSTHRFTSLLYRLGMHAAYSPLVKSFKTYPVESPEFPTPSIWKKGLIAKDYGSSDAVPRNKMHDTMLLMEFRSERAREQWIATNEWQDFMLRTENKKAFRRVPHVRCASSVRGLMDPVDILTSQLKGIRSIPSYTEEL